MEAAALQPGYLSRLPDFREWRLPGRCSLIYVVKIYRCKDVSRSTDCIDLHSVEIGSTSYPP